MCKISKNKILIILILVFVPFFNAAAFIVDTNVHARPSNPPSFSLSHKAIDPTFGTIFYRLTGPAGSNALMESNESQNLAPIQHFHSPWSMSGDHFLVWTDRLSEGAGARVDLFELDRNNFTIKKLRTVGSPIHFMNYNNGVHFSHAYEWIVYAVDTDQQPNAVKRCNLSLDTSFDGLAPNTCENLFIDPSIIQMTQSDDDDLFSYYTNNSHVKVWKRSTSSFIFDLDASSWYSFDESQISPDGKWVFVKGHQVQGDHKAWVYDSTNSANMRFYDAYTPDYFAGKHSGAGNMWVNETTQFSNYKLVSRNISVDAPNEDPWTDGSPRFIFSHPAPLSQSGSMHPSYGNGYVYGGFFRETGLPNPWVPYMDEIVRIKDDGTEVVRLGHAWSNFYSNSYDEIPTYASPAGDYVIFYSNWNGQNSSARHDVFIIDARSSVDIPKYSTSDFIYLISNWHRQGTNSDLNSDNFVNTKDLGIMMSKWN